uniref:Immunoglobulin domain-containing protein n=1 Tax=Sinocyclocheilus grahami TaxID=75366 RepID=A0A672LGN2_SINGR
MFVDKTESMPKSVIEGEPVTLNTDRTELQRGGVIEWKFGGSVIAKISRAANKICQKTYDGADERFRNRLELDCKTGSLTITNSRTTDSGDYQLQIATNGKVELYRKFNVSVFENGLNFKFPFGDSVTLHTTVSELQSDDIIEWMREDNVIIAEVKNNKYEIKNNNPTNDVPDRSFEGRLELDHKTGSLTIKNITSQHEGIYILDIGGGHLISKNFSVTLLIFCCKFKKR